MSSLIHKNIIPVVAIVIFDKSSQKYLIVRRAENQSGAGFWEFPGGKVEGSEAPMQALSREIDEELGLQIDTSKLQFVFKQCHAYSSKDIEIAFYLYPVQNAMQLTLVDHDDSCWCAVGELRNYKIAEADIAMITYLENQVTR